MIDLFLKSFIALFVAIDAVGALPFVVGITKSMTPEERRGLIYKSSAAALAVGFIFVFGGRAIFAFLGILENDFRIAGGLLLIVFAIRDLLVTASHQGSPTPIRAGIVPIAVPLMMGPAALATLMVSTEQYGLMITVASLVLNLVFVWVLFSKAPLVLRILGDDTSDAIAKIFSLLLAAIGVMLVRSGLQGLLVAAAPMMGTGVGD